MTLKTSTIGIDTHIQKLQSKLSSDLTSTWSLTSADFFGRIYRTRKKGKFIPEGFKIGTNSKEYQDVLFNDKKDCVCFFYVSGIDFDSEKFTSDVDIIFQLRTSVKNVTHRADAEIIKDVTDIMRKEPYGFKMIGVESDIENVYSDFDIDIKDYDRLEPFFVFSIRTELKYK